MILGASETFTDYCAPLAWQHAGFTSYPLAVSAAQGTLYASMLRESAKRQSPAVYVVEVNGFSTRRTSAREFRQGRNAQMARHAAALTQQGAGHSRVRAGQAPVVPCAAAQIPRQLRKPDLIRNSLSLQQQARDAGYSVHCRFCPSPCSSRRRMRSPCASNRSTFQRAELRTFCETARAQGIKNVLFARFPHRTVIENYDAVFAELEAVVHEYGYDFANFDTQMDAIGLDPLNDFANAEHLNIFGAEKFTPYLADYLARSTTTRAPRTVRPSPTNGRAAPRSRSRCCPCARTTPGATRARRLDEFRPYSQTAAE